MHPAHLRASDADRERTVELLRGHAAVGRLTVDELDDRSARALSAVTLGDLSALTTDLPHGLAAVQRQAPGPPPKLPHWPGKYHFAERWRAPARRERAMSELLEHVAPPLHRAGYALVQRTEDRLVFHVSRRPAWTIVVAILIFPIGLLALLYKQDEQLVIDLHQDGETTLVSASGVAPLAVRRAFAALEG